MLFEPFFNVLAPHYCLGCGAEGSLLCAGCALALPAVPPRCYRCLQPSGGFRTCTRCRPESELVHLWPVTPYTGVAKQVLHRLKFERAQAAARDIAAAMQRLPVRGHWLVTHMPTAPSRVRLRGYDQARLIAKEFARLSGQPYLPLLARSGNQRQLGQSRAVRQQQLRAAFRAMHAAKLSNQRVLLIDDVVTTGASCESAAAVLQAAGARQVCAAVFAAA